MSAIVIALLLRIDILEKKKGGNLPLPVSCFIIDILFTLLDPSSL